VYRILPIPLASPDIRAADDRDAKAIAALIQRTLRVSNAADYAVDAIGRIHADYTPDRVLARIRARDVFVAELAGVLVGTVGYGAGQLWGLFVAPEQQRLGIGRLLVAHIEDHARHRGARELGLAASLTGVDFYEKLGYRRLGRQGAGNTGTWSMTKRLD
jgi:GNAT superfamily N-acetyltransferase